MATEFKTTARRGFTLVELLIGIILVGIVGAALTRTLMNMQRGSRAQTARVALQGNVRAGITLLPSELREVSVEDIVAFGADNITYRASRTASVACLVTPVAVVLRADLTYGYRGIEAGRDELLIFFDNDEEMSSDDSWGRYAIRAVANGVCPDGAAGTVLTLPGPGILPDSVLMVSGEPPVRTVETMEFRHYESGGKYWLGAHSVSGGGGIEPVLGPLTADGLLLEYRDRADAQTAVVANMRSILVTIKGETDNRISTSYDVSRYVEEQLTARVRLRNAPNF